MKKKIDGRLPNEVEPGMHTLKAHSAVKSPWEKLISYKEAAHYASRYGAVFSSALMQAYRILIPDYAERSDMLCRAAYGRLRGMYDLKDMVTKPAIDNHNIHPFCCGNFIGGLHGDDGDEAQLMCGRVNDFGTYRVEKELDVCDWDIVGSELCRATTQSLMGCADGLASELEDGDRLDYCMVEARGCGDLHCRIVAESREKYPMPEHAFWETFGPIATADQIKFTPEEEMVKEPECFRPECNYKFVTGTCEEKGTNSVWPNVGMSHGGTYILPAIEEFVKAGRLDSDFANHVIHCICEAAGKAVFSEYVARDAIRYWMGVPANMEDGRIIGGHIEMYLQSAGVDYKIIAFNKDEVIYNIDTYMMCGIMPQMGRVLDAYVAFWNGMTKTLVNSQWFLWREEAKEGILRIKIAKKIDKFC